MAALPPLNDPMAAQDAADAAVAMAAAMAAGVGGGAGGFPPDGGPPPPLVPLPLASPSPIARAIWAKVPEAGRAEFSTNEMRTYHQILQGANPNPEP